MAIVGNLEDLQTAYAELEEGVDLKGVPYNVTSEMVNGGIIGDVRAKS